MTTFRMMMAAALASLMLQAGCATRPINPPLAHADPNIGYRYATREQFFRDKEDLIILAFSGGGTRAAAGQERSSLRTKFEAQSSKC